MARADNSQRGVLISVESARRIAKAVQAYEQGRRRIRAPRIRTAYDGNGGDGGPSLKLGRTTEYWAKDTLADIVIFDAGSALDEEFSAPPEIQADCVNKFANVEAGAWVLIGLAHGRWYLVSAECEVDSGSEGSS